MSATPAKQESDMDEGNILTEYSTRFVRMLATPPCEIRDKVSEWTSHKTPAEGHVKVALASIQIEPALYNGVAVKKVSSYGKFKNRILTVSQDKFALFVTHQRIKGTAMSHVAHKLPLPLYSRKSGFKGFATKDYREQYVRYIDVADLQGCMMGVVDTQNLESSRELYRLKGLDSTVDLNHEEIVTIFHHGNRTLDVLVQDESERKALVATIIKLVDTYKSVMEHVSSQARLLRYIWYDLDRNHDGHLDVKEFTKLLNRINLFPTPKTPKELFCDFKKQQEIRGKSITYRQCMDLLTQYQQGKLGDKSQVDVGLEIFTTTFGANEDYVTASVFLEKFLKPLQHEDDVQEKDVLQLFESLNSMELNRDEAALRIIEGKLSKFRFGLFLHHSINDAYNPDDLHQSQSLEESMSRYWINTSHNTYLTGDQLQSYSSVEMYVKALRRGCKCLELDCWDGETKEDGTPIPVVFHGHTLTTKILFQDVLAVVNAHVKANPNTFPIILSLENHCSKPYQQVMASLLKQTLGDALYVPSSKDTTMDGDLPSPKALQGKVVIKGKRPPEPDDAPVGNSMAAGSTELEDEEDPYSVVDSGVDDGVDKKNSTDSLSSNKTDVAKSSKILPELAKLTLFHGTKYKSFERSIHAPPSHMHSIGESKITKIVEQAPENPGLWQMYNLHHMTRTYPAGARVDSSNYNPVLAWAMGCQMVALNFQTSDTPLMLNDGRFRQNGSTGYVLKPPAILGLAERAPAKTLKVRVLSGECLPKPDGDTTGETIDPYVRVTVHDVVTTPDHQEFKTNSYSTATINDNGFHPVWNEKEFHTFTVEFPEVAMVHFNLMESDVTIDDKVADACIPFSCLRRGYRSIQLYNRFGARTGPFNMATLLVEIDYE